MPAWESRAKGNGFLVTWMVQLAQDLNGTGRAIGLDVGYQMLETICIPYFNVL